MENDAEAEQRKRDEAAIRPHKRGFLPPDIICDTPGCGAVIAGPHRGERATGSDFAYRNVAGKGAVLTFKGGPCAYGKCQEHSEPGRAAWEKHLAQQRADLRRQHEREQLKATYRQRMGPPAGGESEESEE
jgi:hypothetical protein